ncbi:hypothetical protein TIFTF001_033626 [Ficus carica]|uniref:Uncharacterized protein n=1 Tax=Ficus carica TaxID=3494 RepID=A0AA88DYK4_FICCA|nr:hypothetical protein TIFTF001_033626 [Ficus carica]
MCNFVGNDDWKSHGEVVEMKGSDGGWSAKKMKMVEMERSDGGGSVKKTKVANEDTCEWMVENGSVGGYSTDEIRVSGR